MPAVSGFLRVKAIVMRDKIAKITERNGKIKVTAKTVENILGILGFVNKGETN